MQKYKVIKRLSLGLSTTYPHCGDKLCKLCLKPMERHIDKGKGYPQNVVSKKIKHTFCGKRKSLFFISYFYLDEVAYLLYN